MTNITIKKAKGGVVVSVIAKNGQKLSTSEVLKTKQSAIKNIMAQARAFGVKQVWVETWGCLICVNAKTGVV